MAALIASLIAGVLITAIIVGGFVACVYRITATIAARRAAR